MYAYLANNRAQRRALAALVASIILFASVAYLAGQLSVVSLAGELFGYLTFTLFRIAMWRSGILPQGAAILWLATGVLFPASGLSVWTDALGFVLFALANAWIASAILRQPSTEVMGPNAQQRVVTGERSDM